MLENKTVDLSTTVDHARAFGVARPFRATVNAITEVGLDRHRSVGTTCVITAPKNKSYFCACINYNRNRCPAKEDAWHKYNLLSGIDKYSQ